MNTTISLEARTDHFGGIAQTWVESGEGSTVVLLHGSLSDYRYWSPQMGPLAASHRVVAPSLRHHFPAQDSDTTSYSAQLQVQDVVALIAGRRLGPVHLIGHSRGAMISLMVALSAPGMVRSLVLADPAVQIHGSGLPGAHEAGLGAKRRPDRTDPRAHAAALISVGDVDAGLALFIDTVSGPGIWARMNSRRKQMARDNACSLVGQLTEGPMSLTPKEIQSVCCPILLIGGDRSPAPYPQTRAALSALLPDARQAEVPVASHAMNVENPRVFNDELLAFLSAV